MSVSDNKYVVFRREPAKQIYNITDAIDDAVVVRRQDLFAPAVLFGYASQVLGVADILGELVVEIEDKEVAKDLHELRQDLLAVWDYFNRQGQEAQRNRRKLPD